MVSIRDSVHSLLKLRIEQNGWDKYFTVQQNEIRSISGGTIIFKGIRNDPNQIKGIPDLRKVWIEEAVDVTENSYDVIYHTILRNSTEGKPAELLVTFNPDYDDDYIYKTLISSPVKDGIIRKVNYTENKYLDKAAVEVINELKETNYSKYLHIYEGEPITEYASLVYRFERKVNEVPDPLRHMPGVETIAGWDFGVSDDTAIIVMQIHQVPKSAEYPRGLMIRVIDELVTNNKEARWYRDEMDRRGYRVDFHFCDPSGSSRDSSLSSWVEKIGYNFDWTHSFSPAEMIDNANEYVHAVRVNRHQCPRTYSMFTHWQYKTDKQGSVIMPPKALHDEHSHPATAFYYALTNRFPPRKKGGEMKIGTG